MFGTVYGMTKIGRYAVPTTPPKLLKNAKQIPKENHSHPQQLKMQIPKSNLSATPAQA